MNQSHQLPPPRRQQSATAPYGAQLDELHMSGMSPQSQMASRDYAPQIKLEPSPVPNVLQPGGMSRPPLSANNSMSGSIPGSIPGSGSGSASASASSAQHQQGYQSPPKPVLNMSHTYSRSSPAANYDTPASSSSYHAYTPTTPSGSSSQFISPQDGKYNAPGSQRTFSNTPLGLADIRPRADSSMSDGAPGTLGYEVANTQPGPSNYLAPWPIYAFDWCKWTPRGNGAGKVAVGSYLEDGHNFVSQAVVLDVGC